MRVDPFSAKAKPSRRLFLKAMGIAAGVVASSGVVMSSAKATNKAVDNKGGGADPAIATAPALGKQSWTFPDHAKIIRMMNDRHYVGGDNRMWHDRAMGFVDSLWPAMAVVASQRAEALSEAIYHEMMSVSGMEQFVLQNRGLPEAAAVQNYLTRVPGYGIDDYRAQTEMHHGFLAMQASYAINLSKEAVA
jgi:hypothetical protein